ncbi:MAG: tRNA 2-thiouridine(34) synthase MnmA [Actinobacteria bacterium]|nr:tRNA 2-thiouridine(34) synthase MnmA [Actinomycetota bacterium]
MVQHRRRRRRRARRAPGRRRPGPGSDSTGRGVGPVRVLVMMSGGVDSSVAAALLVDEGHEVVGATLKLWGGESDSGCCSISDVDDARRVADHLGIDHHTFNFGDAFTEHVVAPYAADHAAGRTPNPCIECNRHIKFAAVDERARRLGFDAVATGHHARVVQLPDGTRRIARGADADKDQSYVLHVLDQDRLSRTLLPIGGLHKDQVRAHAAAAGLRTASKPDSQDVCFITKAQGRGSFLGDRIPLTPARVVDVAGTAVGHVAAVELVTLGQRKGLGLPGGTDPRYVVGIDRATATVTVGGPEDLLVAEQLVAGWAWSAGPESGDVAVQVSAHGRPKAARVVTDRDGGAVVRWAEPQRRVAAGQSVVAYVDDLVVGGGTAT